MTETTITQAHEMGEYEVHCGKCGEEFVCFPCPEFCAFCGEKLEETQ